MNNIKRANSLIIEKFEVIVFLFKNSFSTFFNL